MSRSDNFLPFLSTPPFGTFQKFKSFNNAQDTVGMKVIRIQSLQKGLNFPFLLSSTLYLGRKGQVLKEKLHLYYKNYLSVFF